MPISMPAGLVAKAINPLIPLAAVQSGASDRLGRVSVLTFNYAGMKKRLHGRSFVHKRRTFDAPLGAVLQCALRHAADAVTKGGLWWAAG